MFSIILYTSVQFISFTGVLKSPVLTYWRTYNAKIVSWSPVSNDGACGPVSYNVIVNPPDGMVVRVSNTAYKITGLCYDTNYNITVYATNNVGNGEPATIIVKTPSGIQYTNVH